MLLLGIVTWGGVWAVGLLHLTSKLGHHVQLLSHYY
jgi:hypothetical protein